MRNAPATPLAGALADGVVLLDGGLSNQLEDQGNDLADELWSARLLAEDPAQIEAAHAAYVRAGARVLITSSYQASFEGFARRGLGADDARELFRRSVRLARSAGRAEARAEVRVAGAGPVWVAGSVGPYGAVLADGSEYRGRYGLSVRELTAFHRPRVEALAEAEPDVLALETVPDVAEAEALLGAVAGCGLPVWLSFTVAGGRTRAGQPLAEAFAVAAGNPQVLAVGVNCCAADEVGPALETAARACPGTPLVAYPNSGEGWDARRAAWTGARTFAPSLAREWTARGARLVGGCCRVGPGAIAALGETLGRAG
ncbi:MULTISPECIES: homocysteine S-methyltransferase [unclassified Streptomyces]|uniref:homocysteine S-methyltransferase n=1 Tax=unclassified Streptomyces TaxID=2593676 RepID=UPI002DDB2F00|nr:MULTISPECIES: homocysteine S-methyltransferase [unclassified Streptomyces]WSA91841.1 homocysteine S-methyltransferase [Streptomyces sp. NBC_01795]WSB76211.1 homocysteine S-methyltransferase [Streptomyces sp. NBC_01775]WSS15515.1 homocysteine S-methyltransferase [Streptomyces sp. NBC_01186]WSS44357.1 homocysteine S-methyltransferase [Streptomyces sp. NBC_01187]